MKLSGQSILGLRQAANAGEPFAAINPRTGAEAPPNFFSSALEDVDLAASLSNQAFAVYGRAAGREKAKLLRVIAAKIDSAVDGLVERAELESALPKPRLIGETARKIGQLRLFADVVEEGSWVSARIDRADANRKPVPRPDIRSMLHPLGPVAIFGASNFPLAFSVAGGDTASALAAGNPVIVKAHPAHPGTSELVGRLLQESVRECGLPEGVFSLLFDSGNKVGVALVKHPLVKAVGFTGSLHGGRALMDAAAARPDPIPVFAEMGSTNPVFILPRALRERADAIAGGLHASFTMGAGQFCTKPGMVLLPDGVSDEPLITNLQKLVRESKPFNLLTPGIRSAYQAGVERRKAEKGVAVTAERQRSGDDSEVSVDPSLFEIDFDPFMKNPQLADELFGPTTLLIRHSSRAQILDAASKLHGHLTATVHGTEDDLNDFAELVEVLKTKVGRIVFNGFPTGVEVSHAMIHGGPYPATSDGRSTSVGSQAIFRFSRPVCYQGFPQAALPEELRDDNPLQIWRMLDGQMTKAPVA